MQYSGAWEEVTMLVFKSFNKHFLSQVHFPYSVRENVTYDHFILLCFNQTDMSTIEKNKLMKSDKHATIAKLIKSYAVYKKVSTEKNTNERPFCFRSTRKFSIGAEMKRFAKRKEILRILKDFPLTSSASIRPVCHNSSGMRFIRGLS